MNIQYEFDTDVVYLTLSEAEGVATQMVTPDTHVKIGSDGSLVGVRVEAPGKHPWPVREILERYPMNVNQSFLLVTLSERYLFFRF